MKKKKHWDIQAIVWEGRLGEKKRIRGLQSSKRDCGNEAPAD